MGILAINPLVTTPKMAIPPLNTVPADDGAAMAQIHAWLAGVEKPAVDSATLRPAPALGPTPDGVPALYRVDGRDGAPYLVIATGDATSAYERASDVLADAGLGVPPIAAAGPRHVLAHDPGSLSYAVALNLDSAHQLHMDAIGALLALQAASQPDVLPGYGRAELGAELTLFLDWYVGRHLGVTPDAAQRTQLDKVFGALLDAVCAQPQVYVHRNFQPRSLLVQPGTPGVLGFEGAAFGPLAYDLVSLLRDSTNAWDEEMVLDWAVRYWQAARQAGLPVDADIDAFYSGFELAGLQRHLMQLGLYARMAHRDGDRAFLAEADQLLDFVRKAAGRYTETRPLVRLLDAWDNRQPQVGYTF
jgi:aminoglycoside/choline kinase family phosphotransferase